MKCAGPFHLDGIRVRGERRNWVVSETGLPYCSAGKIAVSDCISTHYGNTSAVLTGSVVGRNRAEVRCAISAVTKNEHADR